MEENKKERRTHWNYLPVSVFGKGQLKNKRNGIHYCLRNPDGNARIFNNVFKLSGFETS